MAGWIKQKIDGLKFRLQSRNYGIMYGRSSEFSIPDKLQFEGEYRHFKFNRLNEKGFEYEFAETCLRDAYKLRSIKKKIKVSRIVDIGANQGLFLLAARKEFPNATIHGYEPNADLEKYLSHNAAHVDTMIFQEAVAQTNGFVDLEFGDSDLETRTVFSNSGRIVAVDLDTVIKRIGGSIDILKMDCEGAEWDILNSPGFENVRSITMEYHLWAKPGMKVSEVEKILTSLDYKVIHKSELTDSFGLITAIRE